MRHLCNYLLLLCGVSLGCVASAETAAAQGPTSRPTPTPITAGELALKMNKLDEDALATVLSAIGSDDPLVRTVAARMAAVTTYPPFGNALVAALANERDARAATEQVRALLITQSPLAERAIEGRLAAVPAVPRAYANWIATNEPERLPGLLPKLATALGDDRGRLRPSLDVVLKAHPDLAERLLRAWLDISTPEMWRSVLNDVHEHARTGQDAVVLEALTSSRSEIREVTVWNFVERLANNRAIAPALVDAAARGATREPTAANAPMTWEQFGREVLAWDRDGRQTPDRSALLTAEAGKHLPDAVALSRIRQILEPERSVLKGVLGDRFPTEPQSSPKINPPSALPSPVTRPGSQMRTMPPEWRGFLKQVLDAAKCSVGKAPMFGVMYVTYRPNGTPTHLQLSVPTHLPAGCEAELTALARLTLADPAYLPRPGEREALIMPFVSDFVECANNAGTDVDEPKARIGTVDNRGRKIVPPKKVRDMRPEYPKGAQQDGVQGTVVSEGIISRNGCISYLKVIQSLSPTIDFAALRAITQWQFTPTLLDGEPVPVVMTVTVTFHLQ
jgi:TonB family protein